VLDDIVSGDGGSGEGGDDDLNHHHYEEEDADGQLRERYSRALFVNILSAVCIPYAFDGVHGEIHHRRDSGDIDSKNVGREVGGDL